MRTVMNGVETTYGKVSIKVGRYSSGGAICVVLESEGEPYGVLSTNLRPYGHEIQNGEFHAKTWGENEELVQPMLAKGLFVDTGKRAQSGYVTAEVWKLVNAALVP